MSITVTCPYCGEPAPEQCLKLKKRTTPAICANCARLCKYAGRVNRLGEYEKDNALLGLQIIAKYLPNSGVEGAGHDIIYSADIDDILEAGITEGDAMELRNMNWMINNGDCLACFV